MHGVVLAATTQFLVTHYGAMLWIFAAIGTRNSILKDAKCFGGSMKKYLVKETVEVFKRQRMDVAIANSINAPLTEDGWMRTVLTVLGTKKMRVLDVQYLTRSQE